VNQAAAPASPGRLGTAAGGWQCGHCLTLYPEQYGDEEQGIPAGTPFTDIRADYVCSVCGGATVDFVPL